MFPWRCLSRGAKISWLLGRFWKSSPCNAPTMPKTPLGRGPSTTWQALAKQKHQPPSWPSGDHPFHSLHGLLFHSVQHSVTHLWRMINHPNHLHGLLRRTFSTNLSHGCGKSWRNNIQRTFMTPSRSLPCCLSRNCCINQVMVGNLPSSMDHLALTSTSQITNTSLSKTLWQHLRQEFYNIIPRSSAYSVTRATFLEVCRCTSDNIPFVTYVVRLKGKCLRYIFICHVLFNDLMHTQLGVEPCGFCGIEGCTIKLDQTTNNCISIVSNCWYAFTSYNYEQAKIIMKTSPCMNLPISCPFCLSLQCDHFIWKYNAVTHIAT